MPRYFARRDFTFGSENYRLKVAVRRGDVVDFDGTTVYINDGEPIEGRACKGAVTAGWLRTTPRPPTRYDHIAADDIFDD